MPGIALWSPNHHRQPLGCSWSRCVPAPPFMLSSAAAVNATLGHEQRAPSAARLINEAQLIPRSYTESSGSTSHQHRAGRTPRAGTHWSGDCPGAQSPTATTESPFLWQHPATKTLPATKTTRVSQRIPEGRRSPSSRNAVGEPTGDVGGDLGERRLAEALAGAGPHREQVGGAGVEVGEHVVGLVAQLGHRAPRAWHIHRRVRGLDALVADLQGQGTASPVARGEGTEPGLGWRRD